MILLSGAVVFFVSVIFGQVLSCFCHLLMGEILWAQHYSITGKYLCHFVAVLGSYLDEELRVYPQQVC